MVVKSSQIRMKCALADFSVDLGFMALTTSYDKRREMLKRGLPLRTLLEETASYVSYLWFRAISSPAQYPRRFGENCVSLLPSFLDRRGDKFNPMPLIKSLLPRPLLPRSFELPKSCRECPTISQSAFLPARPPFIKQFFTPVSPQRSSRYTCSS